MTRRERDAQARRQTLLRAAEALFLRHGFDATSVAAIVQQVGVAQGTFYYHFPSKVAVAEAIVDGWVARVHSRLRDALAAATDPAEQVCLALDELGDVMHEHRYVICALLQPTNDWLHGRFAARLGEVLLSLFQEVVGRGIVAGRFHVEHARETLELLLAGLARLTRAHHAGNDEATLARLHAATESLFLRALGAPDRRAASTAIDSTDV